MDGPHVCSAVSRHRSDPRDESRVLFPMVRMYVCMYVCMYAYMCVFLRGKVFTFTKEDYGWCLAITICGCHIDILLGFSSIIR
jgi:hypothetical protein